MSFSFTVKELLTKSHFPKAALISGKSGLKRQIKWVHILETTTIEELIKGNELILTTGIQLKEEATFLRFVQQLIDKQAAALCIECCENIQSVPESVQQLAEQFNFPILVFHEVVPFIEITQYVHTHVINEQFNQIKRLEDYAQEINKLTLKLNHYEQILMRLHQFLDVYVVFHVHGQQPLYTPNHGQSVYEQLCKQSSNENIVPSLAKCDVTILEESYGEVCIFSDTREITEFDILVLDRTVIALSQYLLRSLYTEEKQNMEYRTFLESWLDGTVEAQQLTAFLNEQHNPKLLNCDYFVLIEKIQKSKQNIDLTYYKLYSRGIFEKSGFTIFLIESRQQLVYIVANLMDKDLKRRITNCIDKLHAFRRNNNYSHLKITTGVGQVVDDLHLVAQSFETAKDTLLIRTNARQLSYFYEDIYIYQLVLQMQKNRAIMDMAKNHLKALYEHDAKHKGQLIQTLQVYLQCNCMKQETAEKLFIVRQTLYHRLSKIESFLGADFTLPPKRLTLELMLLATQYNFYDSEEGTV